MIVDGHHVEISVEHVTEPAEGGKGSRFLASCGSLEDLTKILNDSKNKPPLYWEWKIEFQDILEESQSECEDLK